MGYRSENILQDNAGIDLAQAVAFAPTLNAIDPHFSRSERYGMVPTLPILQGLMTQGFQMHSISKATVRAKSAHKLGFERHMLRLRHADAAVAKVGGTVNEIIIINSHDGTSCFDMRAGMFRFVCSNGLIVGNHIAGVKIMHKGDIINQVIEGAFHVMKTFEEVTESRERMMAIELKKDEKMAFAEAAMPLRFGEDTAFKPEHLLAPRRQEDMKDDLWTVFNTVQENCIKGGQKTWMRGTNGRARRTSTKEITGISQNVSVNAGLHILATRMAELKEAA